MGFIIFLSFILLSLILILIVIYFYKQLYLDLSDAYEYTSAIMAKNVQEDYAIEGINAFLEKRDPNWNDN